MVKHTIDNLDRGQLELMWNFLKMGNGKPNISALKENLDALRQMLIQKTAGQEPYKKSHEIPFEDYDTIINCIVIEAMQLYLSGTLNNLEDLVPAKSGQCNNKHGYWKQNDVFECSVCQYRFEPEGYLPFFNYCPSCGARMDGDDR